MFRNRHRRRGRLATWRDHGSHAAPLPSRAMARARFSLTIAAPLPSRAMARARSTILPRHGPCPHPQRHSPPTPWRSAPSSHAIARASTLLTDHCCVLLPNMAGGGLPTSLSLPALPAPTERHPVLLQHSGTGTRPRSNLTIPGPSSSVCSPSLAPPLPCAHHPCPPLFVCSPSLVPPLPCAHHPWSLPFRVLAIPGPSSSVCSPSLVPDLTLVGTGDDGGDDGGSYGQLCGQQTLLHMARTPFWIVDGSGARHALVLYVG
jgi:hypothetical protein